MTKSQIKKLIVDSDYKNKDITIWWRYKGFAMNAKAIIKIAKWDDFQQRFYHLPNLHEKSTTFSLSRLVDFIKAHDYGKTFELDILEENND